MSLRPRGEEPLIAREPSAQSSRQDEFEEEDSLLAGRPKDEPSRGRRRDNPRRDPRRIRERIRAAGGSTRKYIEIGLFAWAVIATVALIVLAVFYEQSRHRKLDSGGANPSGKRNLVFMVSDGMGPTSLSLTRSFRQYDEGLSFNDALVLDKYVVGQSRTASSSSLITDSAAGATAFSCGQKSYNGAISVDPDHAPCGTVLEAAKRAGYMTGLVVTTRITDATPACFASHVNMRDEEDRIAEQLLGEYPLGRTVDLMLGAGRCHFLPNTAKGSCRDDTRDLVKAAKDKGFKYMDNRKDFDNTRFGSGIKLPLLGLFADHDIPYEVDRRFEKDDYPSLDEMADVALRALHAATRDNDKGFFLMVEGSRIDHAGHANDPVAQVHEVLAYDRAFDTVLNFLKKDTTPGLLLATSDHETGGLATARQPHEFHYPEYLWHPSVLANASRSVEWLTGEYEKFLGQDNALKASSATKRAAVKARRSASDSSSAEAAADTDSDSDDEGGSSGTEKYLRAALRDHLGIEDPTTQEMSTLINKPHFAPYHFATMISSRSQTGWTTHGHSGADVNIYASDPKAVRGVLDRNVENIEIGGFMRRWLGVEGYVDKIERELKDGMGGSSAGSNGNTWRKDWMGEVPDEGVRLDGQNHTSGAGSAKKVKRDHYQNDFAKHKRCTLCESGGLH
ncbi:MAG: hypothetical protein M1831_006551 [Alyxoria varia]|nr:MAG: hypothetical protein M1831_006551 [Alyxoria varia]